jgi:Sec-independent protein secretion pathway component TatC
MGPSIQRTMQGLGVQVAGWYYPVMGVISLLNMAAVVGIWQWKKWGVYLYVGLSVLSIVLSVIAGMSPVMVIVSSLIGFAILFFLVRPLWDHFEG